MDTKPNQMDYEQAMEAANLKKEDLKAAKAELKAFRKENSIKPDETPTDEKILKKFNKLTATVEKAEEAHNKALEAAKELKPKTARPSKYEYPEGMTAAEKKKFRAKARAEKKRADNPKPEKPAKEAKAEKEAKPEKKKKNREEEED